MNKKVIVGNWKMNNLNANVTEFMQAVNEALQTTTDVELGVCVPFVYLANINKAGILKVGAQNMHELDSGAYTGEVSAPMLQDIDCHYVIIGHSERRQYFNETDKAVNAKVIQALKYGLTPIVCCGESLEQYNASQTKAVVEQQLLMAFENVSSLEAVIIAYEPIWAIGTGLSATSSEANDVCKYIREVLAKKYGDASNVVIQYGGSVKANNISEYLSQSDIDGALVGGASVNSNDFIELIKAI